jgi:hypothetical protein
VEEFFLMLQLTKGESWVLQCQTPTLTMKNFDLERKTLRGKGGC